MPTWAQAIVTISDSLRPALPALVTLLAAWLAWIAIHRVSRLNAKRDAYARYVGAAEIYSHDYRRWVAAMARARPSAMVEPVRAGPVNEPLGAILLVAPKNIALLVQASQQALSDLSAAAHGAGEWNAALAHWKDVEMRLINGMRGDSGTDPLPPELFSDE